MAEIEDDCPHCSPTHGDPNAVPWGVWVHSDRDGDGQPTMLAVAKSDGAHVAESDAEWLRGILREHDARRALAAELRTLAADCRRDACGLSPPYCWGPNRAAEAYEDAAVMVEQALGGEH